MITEVPRTELATTPRARNLSVARIAEAHHHHVHAGAVGIGIYLALEASAATHPASPEEWVEFACRAGDEAHAEAMENPPLAVPGPVARLLEELEGHEPEQESPDSPATRAAAKEAARTAYRMCMPKLTGRRATQAYIACVAAGVQRGYLAPQEATSLLYTAQLALAAWPSKRAQRGKGTQK